MDSGDTVMMSFLQPNQINGFITVTSVGVKNGLLVIAWECMIIPVAIFFKEIDKIIVEVEIIERERVNFNQVCVYRIYEHSVL